MVAVVGIVVGIIIDSGGIIIIIRQAGNVGSATEWEAVLNITRFYI